MREIESDDVELIMRAIIDCESCGESDEICDASDIGASEHFTEQGWRVSDDGEVLCPECVKRRSE